LTPLTYKIKTVVSKKMITLYYFGFPVSSLEIKK